MTRWAIPTDSHIHKLDWTGTCACGFTLYGNRRVIHTRTDTTEGRGPVYLTLDIGINRCMVVQKQCNYDDLQGVVAVLEETIHTLRVLMVEGERRRAVAEDIAVNRGNILRRRAAKKRADADES